MGIYNPRRMWFGTTDRMQWIETPQQGADFSAEGWSAGGTLLNGGGWGVHSWDTHRNFTFEWRESSAYPAATKMESYRKGVFGRGLVYFIPPTLYTQNALPSRWASPAIACDFEGYSHIYGIEPESVAVSGGEDNDLPVASAYYNMTSIAAGFRGAQDAVFIPIPEGMTLYLSAFYSATLTGGVYVTEVNPNGSMGSGHLLASTANTDSEFNPNGFSGGRGVYLWFGKSSADASTLTVTALIARLAPTTGPLPSGLHSGPWVGGMGHSGCRFSGVPTFIANTGIDGGTASYAATFREVGDWS